MMVRSMQVLTVVNHGDQKESEVEEEEDGEIIIMMMTQVLPVVTAPSRMG